MVGRVGLGERWLILNSVSHAESEEAAGGVGGGDINRVGEREELVERKRTGDVGISPGGEVVAGLDDVVQPGKDLGRKSELCVVVSNLECRERSAEGGCRVAAESVFEEVSEAVAVGISGVGGGAGVRAGAELFLAPNLQRGRRGGDLSGCAEGGRSEGVGGGYAVTVPLGRDHCGIGDGAGVGGKADELGERAVVNRAFNSKFLLVGGWVGPAELHSAAIRCCYKRGGGGRRLGGSIADEAERVHVGGAPAGEDEVNVVGARGAGGNGPGEVAIDAVGGARSERGDERAVDGVVESHLDLGAGIVASVVGSEGDDGAGFPEVQGIESNPRTRTGAADLAIAEDVDASALGVEGPRVEERLHAATTGVGAGRQRGAVAAHGVEVTTTGNLRVGEGGGVGGGAADFGPIAPVIRGAEQDEVGFVGGAVGPVEADGSRIELGGGEAAGGRLERDQTGTGSPGGLATLEGTDIGSGSGDGIIEGGDAHPLVDGGEGGCVEGVVRKPGVSEERRLGDDVVGKRGGGKRLRESI